jgi:hypothetical protein
LLTLTGKEQEESLADLQKKIDNELRPIICHSGKNLDNKCRTGTDEIT